MLVRAENKSKIGNQPNLSYLAVSEVVISKNGHHDAAFVSKSNLERLPIVVLFVLIFPAHSRSLLIISGIIHMR